MLHLQLFNFLNFVIKVTSEIKTTAKISENTVNDKFDEMINFGTK